MSQRLTAEEKQYQKRQATVGLASNILGITAGTAALATASKNKAFKRPSADAAGPVTSKVLRKITMSPANQKRLILAGAGGAVGLQAANLGGDLVTNRVLTREVHKNDQSMISKAEGSVSNNGHGKSINLVGIPATVAGTAIAASGASKIKQSKAGVKDSARYAVLADRNAKNAKKFDADLKRSLKENKVLMPIYNESMRQASLRNAQHFKSKEKEALSHAIKMNRGGRLFVAGGATLAGAGLTERAYRNAQLKKKSQEPTKVGIMSKNDQSMISKAEGSVSFNGHGKSLVDVNKAYRRFDPEADRQRRAGLYTGLGVLGAGLAGREAATKFTTKASMNGSKVRGIVARPGKGKAGLGLAALAAASGAFGAQSYKSGLSSRNQPWT